MFQLEGQVPHHSHGFQRRSSLLVWHTLKLQRMAKRWMAALLNVPDFFQCTRVTKNTCSIASHLKAQFWERLVTVCPNLKAQFWERLATVCPNRVRLATVCPDLKAQFWERLVAVHHSRAQFWERLVAVHHSMPKGTRKVRQ